jgi:transposase
MEGHCYSQIGRIIGRSRNCIKYIIERQQEIGPCVRRSGGGRPKKLDRKQCAAVQHTAVMKLKRGEKVNADVMKDISEDIYGVQVSTRTIRRVLNDHKLLKCCW